MGDDFVNKLRDRIERLRDSPQSKSAPEENENSQAELSPTGASARGPRRLIETTEDELAFHALVCKLLSEEEITAEDVVYVVSKVGVHFSER